VLQVVSKLWGLIVEQAWGGKPSSTMNPKHNTQL